MNLFAKPFALPVPVGLPNNADFFAEVLAQLEKDSNLRFSPEPVNPGHPDWPLLAEHLSKALDQTLRNDATVLKGMLYRVDLPEKDSTRLFGAEGCTADELAEAILRRIILKVLLRWQYGGRI
jgi:hypothetical protein